MYGAMSLKTAMTVSPAAAPAGPTRVAQALAEGDGSTYDHSRALPAVDVPAGALIVVKFSSITGSLISGVTDTAGNTYAKSNDETGGLYTSLWYCLSAIGNAANVITPAFSSGTRDYFVTAEVYTGGTWSYDVANSGHSAGVFGTAPSVTSSLSVTGAGVIATAFGQSNTSFARASVIASQSTGDVIASGGQPTSRNGASGEVIHSGDFSGAITCALNTSPASNTKQQVVWASFIST